MNELVLTKHGKDFNNGKNGLTHCTFCGFYSINDFFDSKKLGVGYHGGAVDVPVCGSCYFKIKDKEYEVSQYKDGRDRLIKVSQNKEKE